MREISDIGISILAIGAFLITVFVFLMLFGYQSKLEKRVKRCLMGSFYLVVLIAIIFCKEDSHWAQARAKNVNMRVWASDQQDYESDLGVNLGLQGINITLQVKGRPKFSFNEKFEWAWGTKISMEDGSNPYRRTLKNALQMGMPLPIQDLAESFETYGNLGPASAGMGVHNAGFYTDLFLTVSIVAWIIAGVLPPLSLYASLYAACVSSFSMTLSLILYIVIFYSNGVMDKSKRYFQSADDDSKTEFYLIFSWDFYIILATCLLSATLCLMLRKYAYAVRMMEALKLQQEIEGLKEQRNKRNVERSSSSSSRSSFKQVFKRRLTATWSRLPGELLSKTNECEEIGENVTAVPLSEIVNTNSNSAISKSTVCKNTSAEAQNGAKVSMQAKDIQRCDINYTGPDSTMVYGIATGSGSTQVGGEICYDPLADA